MGQRGDCEERVSPEAFAANVEKLLDNPCEAEAKRDVVELMCDVLAELGYGDGVRKFKQAEL